MVAIKGIILQKLSNLCKIYLKKKKFCKIRTTSKRKKKRLKDVMRLQGSEQPKIFWAFQYISFYCKLLQKSMFSILPYHTLVS